MTSKKDTKLQQASPVQWFFEVVAICAVLVLLAFGVRRLWSALDEAALWFSPVCVLMGYLAADFMSGLTHWLADRYGTVDTTLVGAHFIGPFREHHVDQEEITRHGFVELNGNTSLPAVPVLALTLAWFDPVAGGEFHVDADLVLLAMGFLGPERPGMLTELGVRLNDRGNVWRDANWMTSVPAVFTAGDMHRGQSLIVWAIAEGRSAARAIDVYLMGSSELPAPV